MMMMMMIPYGFDHPSMSLHGVVTVTANYCWYFVSEIKTVIQSGRGAESDARHIKKKKKWFAVCSTKSSSFLSIRFNAWSREKKTKKNICLE